MKKNIVILLIIALSLTAASCSVNPKEQYQFSDFKWGMSFDEAKELLKNKDIKLTATTGNTTEGYVLKYETKLLTEIVEVSLFFTPKTQALYAVLLSPKHFVAAEVFLPYYMGKYGDDYIEQEVKGKGNDMRNFLLKMRGDEPSKVMKYTWGNKSEGNSITLSVIVKTGASSGRSRPSVSTISYESAKYDRLYEEERPPVPNAINEEEDTKRDLDRI
ncbi:MAG: hypothetical protein HQ594_04455 [Candidatus Omnitrophica bacterium]|nr:hypothetical protein [Candidatus Omnitrophota bacterium]